MRYKVADVYYMKDADGKYICAKPTLLGRLLSKDIIIEPDEEYNGQNIKQYKHFPGRYYNTKTKEYYGFIKHLLRKIQRRFKHEMSQV